MPFPSDVKTKRTNSLFSFTPSKNQLQLLCLSFPTITNNLLWLITCRLYVKDYCPDRDLNPGYRLERPVCYRQNKKIFFFYFLAGLHYRGMESSYVFWIAKAYFFVVFYYIRLTSYKSLLCTFFASAPFRSSNFQNSHCS